MTTPSGKKGAVEARRTRCDADTTPNIPSAARRGPSVAYGSAFNSLAPYSQLWYEFGALVDVEPPTVPFRVAAPSRKEGVSLL
jgi:hypothetical protein